MNNEYLNIHPEIKEAIDNNRPVVALESTIISHGMPWPKNVETAKAVEDVDGVAALVVIVVPDAPTVVVPA